MPFQRDEDFATKVDKVFGEYLVTFVSEPRGEVRADVFRRGKRVEAHVWFPTGLDGTNLTEPYVSALRDYASKEGVADQFRIILLDN